MRLNSKVTGGLAWAGLVLVLAVPSADMLTKPSAKTMTAASARDATETASVAPVARPVVPAVKPAAAAATPVAATAGKPTGNDVVEEYVSSGKKLPSYISDAPQTTAQAPATSKPLVVPTAPATAAVAPGGTFAEGDRTEVASVAPVPYPASMRPRPAITTVTLPSDAESPLIVDEEAVAQREATLRAVEPVLADEPQVIGDEQLEEWDSGSLADYLERKGLISEAEQAQPVDSDYDPDGFFLNDGPNRSKARVVRRLRDGEGFLLF